MLIGHSRNAGDLLHIYKYTFVYIGVDVCAYGHAIS